MESTKIMPFLNKTFWGALLINLFLAISVTTVSAHEQQQHPNILLNAQEIAAIKAKVDAGEEPWKSAYNKMISQANTALTSPMRSVTFGGTNVPCGSTNTNDYCTSGGGNDYDFWQGVWPMGGTVRDLGMAYAFTNDPKYAIHLIKLIKVWAIDPATRMNPKFNGNPTVIGLTPSISGLIYGVDLAWNYPGWEPADKVAFKSWVLSFGRKAVNAFGQSERNAADNNFENWRNVFLTVTGAFTGDQTLLATGYDKFQRAITWQVHCTGRMNEEFGRTERWAGRGYSLYAMQAMTITAEVARHQGVDLYNYATKARYSSWTQDRQLGDCGSNRGLKTALDYHAPFFAGTAPWPTSIIAGTPLNSEHGMGIYELAYSVWGESQYLDVVNKWGRPLGTNNWPLGVVTLTHANRDISLELTPPSITTQPESITVTEDENATFSVVATGSGPLTYQWYFNGAEISGANSANYTLTAVSAPDAGTYGCIVTNSEGSDSCNDVTLQISADDTAPTLVMALTTSATGVNVLFSEAVSQSSAENSANYQLDLGISVNAANLNADDRTVSLTVSPALTEEATYTVSVSNVEDRAATPNTIAALSSKIFTYRTADGFEDGNADGWTPNNANGTANRWEVVADEGDNAYFLNTTDYSNLSGKRLGEYSLLAAQYGDFTFTAQAKLGDAVGSNSHADYAVLFGFQDNDNYYYVLFNNDQGSTQVAKIENGNGVELVTAANDWLNDNFYHAIKVSRLGSEIKVYFDDNLIMSASDSTFGAGQVGVGSYNDSAYFDDVSITGEASTTPDTTAPVITLTGNNPQSITVGSAYTELGASATDNVDGNISSNINRCYGNQHHHRRLLQRDL